MNIEATRVRSYPKALVNIFVAPFIGEPRDIKPYKDKLLSNYGETSDINPPVEVIQTQIESSLTERYRKGQIGAVAIPNLSSLITSMIVFADQQKGEIPWNVYPSEGDMQQYYERIGNEYRTGSQKLTIPKLFDVGMDQCDQTFKALSLLTIGTRYVARGMETRAYPNINMDLERRLELANMIAALPKHLGEKEHLGAIYTFGYQAVMGYSTTEAADTKKARAIVTEALIEHLPDLAIFRKITNPEAGSSGNHKAVAKLGFSLGREISRFEKGLIQERDAKSYLQPLG